MVVIYLQSIKPVMILRRDMDGLAGRTSMQYGMTTSLLPANHESFRFFWLKASFMKKHYALLVLALIFVIASFVILSTRPRANKKPPSSRQEPAVARKSRAAAAPVRAFITLERIDPRGESSAALTKRTAA